jgi:hypothetical protein
MRSLLRGYHNRTRPKYLTVVKEFILGKTFSILANTPQNTSVALVPYLIKLNSPLVVFIQSKKSAIFSSLNTARHPIRLGWV